MKLDSIFDSITRFAMRHEKGLAIGAAVWMGLTGAVYARFITLPLIPYITDEKSFWLSGAVNVIWWSVIHPQIDKRRKALADATAPQNAGD